MEKYVVSERGRTYYQVDRCEETGIPNTKNLVFLPGLTADHRLFDPQIAYFSGKYTVLTWDAPAHGKSRPYTDFTYPHLAEELKTILDTEHMERVLLVGQSAGGFVAQSFIARYPERVTGLFTIGTCPYGTDYYSRSDLFWLRQTKWMFALFPDRLLRSCIAKMCGTTKGGRENMRQMLVSYSKSELCRLMYLGFAGFIPEIGNKKLSCPVCLTVGERDRTGKVRKYNEKWHQKDGCPLHIIKGASHNANVDRVQEMNRLIQAFAESIDS